MDRSKAPRPDYHRFDPYNQLQSNLSTVPTDETRYLHRNWVGFFTNLKFERSERKNFSRPTLCTANDRC